MSHHTVHPAKLSVEQVSYTTGSHELIRNISLAAIPGEVVGVVGPNGAGKSTLLRTIYRELPATDGRVLLDRDDVRQLPRRVLARRMAVVPQEHPAEFELTVRNVAEMGRAPHQRGLGGDRQGDARIVMTSLELLGMGQYAPVPFQSLSGGEKQRVLIARALTQEPALLILDEPTNHLDMRYQLQTLALMRRLGFTVLTSLHDLNLAARFCDRIYILHHGQVEASGLPTEVLTPKLLSHIYQTPVDVIPHPRTGTPAILFDTDENFEHTE
jgi:iron complex transport system ATP-binding protein